MQLTPRRVLRQGLLLLVALWAAVAQAADPIAQFEALSVEAHEDWFVVRWRVAPTTWTWFAADGRRPQLVVVVDEDQARTASRTVHTVSLERQAGQARLPLARAFAATEVVVSVQDGADPRARARLAVDGVVADALTLVVSQRHRARPIEPAPSPVDVRTAAPRVPRRHAPETLGRASSDASSPAADLGVPEAPDLLEPTCVTVDPVALVEVCGQTFLGETAQQTCVAAGRRACLDPMPSIGACADAMTGSTEGARCVAAASLFVHPPAPVVRACDDVMVATADKLACVERLSGTPWPPADVVRACGRAVTGSVSTLACLDAAKISPIEPVPIIDACATRTGSAAVVNCVRTAGP